MSRAAALLRRPGFWIALTACLATAGCAAWRIRDAAQMARASEPFEASPPRPVSSLLVVGDSTAVGTGASSPAASVAGLLGERHPGLRIVNRAADGARYEDFIRQLQAGDEQFDVVLVLGGGNDVIRGTRAKALRSQVRRAAGLARQRGEVVVLMPPGNVGHAPFFWPPVSWWMAYRSRVLHGAVGEAARSTGAIHVNLDQPRERDPFAQQPGVMHARDGLHPSDAGYRVWLQELDAQAGPAQRLTVASPAPAGPRTPAPARPVPPAAASRASAAVTPGS